MLLCFNNYRSIVAIGGDNFAVIGADTRLCADKNIILSREHCKLRNLTPKVILGTSGNWCDCDTLANMVGTRVKMYADDHEDREISLNAIVQMMSTKMYDRRFFPYQVDNLLAGIDSRDKKGRVYDFDSIGHIVETNYCATGAAKSLLQPILDSEIGMKNQEDKSEVPLTLDRSIQLIVDAFTSAAERNTLTGDGVVIAIVTEKGVETQFFPLRKD